MKKLIALLLALVMVLGLVACAPAGDDETTGAKNDTTGAASDDTTGGADIKGTIAVIAKGETHAFWQAVKAGAEAAGAEYGYNVTFRGPTAESEEFVPNQREMVQAALNGSDTKAIVLATIGLGFADELVSAYDKGLPVVEFDSGLYDGGADITAEKDPTIGGVATDNFKAGGVVAENFYAHLKANDLAVDGYKVGIIQHDSTATGIDRAGGFKAKMEELAKADNITMEINVQVKANNAGEYKLGLTALKEWGAQAIFCTNEGVINEIFPEISDNAAAYKDILFCGFDAGTNQYNWIKDAGATYALLVGSVAQDSYGIGYEAVALAAKKLAGEEVADVGIGGQWYTAENIDELKDQNIFYMG